MGRERVVSVVRMAELRGFINNCDICDGEMTGHYVAAQQISATGSWEYDYASETIYLSAELARLLWLPSGEPLMVGDLWRYADPDERDRLLAGFEAVADGSQASFRTATCLSAPTGRRWYEVAAARGGALAGAATALVGTVADVTVQLQETDSGTVHRDLAQVDTHHQAVVSASPDPIHVYDIRSGLFSRANLLATALVGYTAEITAVIGGERVEALLSVEDQVRVSSALRDAAEQADGEVVQLRHAVLHEGGVLRWVSRRMTPFKRVDQAVTQILIVSRDVTDIVEAEHKLAHAALHDDLTGLPNRRLLHERLNELLATRTAHPVAVIYLDINGFKHINDYHGHVVGDQVLTAVAGRLRSCLRAGDLVGRMGGDEFAILAQCNTADDALEVATAVAERVAGSMIAPVAVGSSLHRISTSIGICLSNTLDDLGSFSKADGLLSAADAAMLDAKCHRRGEPTVYSDELGAKQREHDRVEQLLRAALTHETIEIHYQPVVHAGTGTWHSVEALARLRDAAGGYLDAQQVITVAERTGLITDIDNFVLKRATRQIGQWRKRHHELRHLGIAVNCSARTVAEPHFKHNVETALSDAGLTASTITLELTETVLLDVEPESLRSLHALKDRGAGIAIDDFGTGYASLRYLATLPVTTLKVDRSFTQLLPHDKVSHTVVQSIISLADKLNLDCVVEGVETKEQIEALPPFRHLLLQGYYYGKALPPEAIPLALTDLHVA